MMQKTKYRGIHYRVNKDGTRSYFLRLTIDGNRTWRRVGDTLSEALEIHKMLKRKKALESLGLEEK